LEAGGELGAARAEADAAERAWGELRLQIDAMARDQLKFEHEIDSLTQKTAAEEKRMYDGSIANARELESLQHEIENLRKRRSDREDELLALMEIREDLESKAAAAEERTAELRSAAEALGGDANRELTTIEQDLATRADERTAIVPDIDPELLELYEELRPQKKGVGAAALIDGVCQGCHEKLSAMEVDRLKHTDGVKRCEYCRRILVL
jgi:predicted  nucleic acid-binding Zn-ribbon protein